MTIQEVVLAMVAEGVTVDEFNGFIESVGIQDDPFVLEVLHQLIVEQVSFNPCSPVTWDPEELNRLFEALSSPVTIIDEFEAWSPGIEAEALMLADREFHSSSEAVNPIAPEDQFETWAPGIDDEAQMLADREFQSLSEVINSVIPEDQFEAWSPRFTTEALRQDDGQSDTIICSQDGECPPPK